MAPRKSRADPTWLLGAALIFLAAHLPLLPPSLEDLDSINFALGARQFDVARHQPHPPGYPVFIALAKGSTALFRAIGVPAAEPRGLAVWSAISGAALVFLLFALIRDLDGDPRRAWWTTLVVAASPLFWFTALRPLSDMTGLAVAVAAQALIAPVLCGRGSGRGLVVGALLAGFGIGVRSQAFLLTLPLLAAALVVPHASLGARTRLAALAAAAGGALAWAVPLVVASGGLAEYLAALGSQAGEDFSGVVILWTMRKPRVALDALMYSFLWPWGGLVVGGIAVAAAAIGAARLAWRLPRVLGVVVLAYVPYAIFHLLFHEVVTVRYALPLVIPCAYLIVYALDALGSRAVAAGSLALVATLVQTIPATIAYGRGPSPAFQAFFDVEAAARRPDQGADPAIAFHAFARRVAEWENGRLPAAALPAPHGREWLALVSHWRSRPDSRVWFVADPRRTDLALFDHTGRRRQSTYRWSFTEPPYVGGARPGAADLYVSRPPGWMLDRGWALSAEVAGVTERDRLGPDRAPSIAWIRSRDEAATLMLGGRHVGTGGGPVRVTVALADRVLDDVEVRPGFFFRVIAVPPGALRQTDRYVALQVRADPLGGGPALPVKLEQFDLQPEGTAMTGFDAGWQEPEYDPRTARAWRWMSERATTWIRPVGRDVTLTLAGESPLRYFDRAPAVTVTAAGREIARFSPAADFTEDIAIPAAALAAAGGRVQIESDLWFSPRDRGQGGDLRHLALRIYSVGVK